MRPTTLWLHDPAPDQSGMGCHTGRWESGASQERRSTEAAVRATTAAAAASARERRRFVQPQQAWGGRRELTKLTAQHERAPSHALPPSPMRMETIATPFMGWCQLGAREDSAREDSLPAYVLSHVLSHVLSPWIQFGGFRMC